MAVKKVSTTSNKKNTASSAVKTLTTTPVAKSTPAPVQTRPYSSPNYTQSTPSAPAAKPVSETRPYSTPNYAQSTTPAAKAVSEIGTSKTPSNAVSNTTTSSGVGKGTPNVSGINSISDHSSTITTPTVTTPAASSVNNLLTPQLGTSVNAAGTINSLLQSQLEDILPTQPEPTLTNANQVLMSQANEKPNETTDRYLNILNSMTGASGTASRPYSNPNYSFNTSNNNARRNSLDEIIEESVYNSLVGEPGSSAPFTEVPQYSLNNANLAVNGPTTVAANQQATPTLSDLIAAQFARDYGTPETNNLITAAIEGTPFNPNAGQTTPVATSALTGAMVGVLGGGGGGDTTNNNYVGGYGGTSGGGGVGGVPAYENGYDLDALYDLLNRQLAEYNNQYDSLMANLLSAYNTNNASLDDYYNQVLAALGNNYADTENLLNGQLNTSQQALEDDRRRALQEAYISRMMQEKALADQLDAYGLTGGASESVMANLRNNYMNNRASVEEKIQASLKDLLQNYLSNMSNARQNYNQAVMNAGQNRLNARQNYANNLAEAQANAANYLANARSGAYENLYNTLAKLALQ